MNFKAQTYHEIFLCLSSYLRLTFYFECLVLSSFPVSTTCYTFMSWTTSTDHFARQLCKRLAAHGSFIFSLPLLIFLLFKASLLGKSWLIASLIRSQIFNSWSDRLLFISHYDHYGWASWGGGWRKGGGGYLEGRKGGGDCSFEFLTSLLMYKNWKKVKLQNWKIWNCRRVHLLTCMTLPVVAFSSLT